MKTKQVAKKLERMGTKGDTVLAHINPEEAAMLKEHGGSGTRNPKTGLLSFSFGDGIAADPADGNSGGGSYGGGGGFGDGAFGTAATETRGFVPSEMSSRNGIGMLADLFESMGAMRGLVPGGNFIGAGLNLADRNGYGWSSGPPGGGLFGGFGGGGSSVGESGMGGDGIGSVAGGGTAGGLLGGVPAVAAVPTYARPAFVSKFGRPRGLLSTGAQLTGFRGV